MPHKQILKDLQNKIYKPIYFLMGEEPYYIDVITDYICDNVLTEDEKSFNQTIVYGKETTIDDVISLSKRYPMMANHQVVVVKEAQHLRNIEDLIYYVQKPLLSTILIINYKYKKYARNKKLAREILKDGVFYESAKLYDNKIPEWISGYLRSKRISIDASATSMLTEFLGSDLSKIVNELNKLILTLPKDSKAINTSHIEKNIGISKDYNNFELTKALGIKDVLKVNRIVNYFAKNPSGMNHITMSISLIYAYFVKVLLYHRISNKSNNSEVASILKVPPFFVNDYRNAATKYNLGKLVQIMSLLREYDLKSKGLNNASTPSGELLKELVFKILH